MRIYYKRGVFMKKVLFIKNAVIMTATALILRLAGMIFKVWLAARVGSEGIGLYQLVLSIYVFVSSFASGGICTAVTRLVTDSLAVGGGKSATLVLKKGIVLSLIVSIFSLALTFFGAETIADRFLLDSRAADAVRILGFSLPFMSISSCLRGYFIARRKTVSSGISQMLEQAVRIIIVLTLAGGFAKKGIAFACAAVITGDVVAEAFSCLYMYFAYRLDRKKLSKGSDTLKIGGYRKIINIAAPITAGRYLNSGLRTVESVMVPKNLALFGGGLGALSQFGMIKGMALPLLFFPSSFLNSVGALLIPEMSEALIKKQYYKIRYATERVITITTVSSFLLASLFFALSEPLSILVYKSREVGALVCALAPIVPLMYLDSICDGMLKGLDRQRFVFFVSVSDSALRLLAIPLIVPRMGMTGFLLIMVLSNLYTAVLRILKLLSVSKAPFLLGKWLIKPLLSAGVSSVVARTLFSHLPVGTLLGVIISAAIAAFVYALLVFFFGCVSRDDLRDIL